MIQIPPNAMTANLFTAFSLDIKTKISEKLIVQSRAKISPNRFPPPNCCEKIINNPTNINIEAIKIFF